MSSPTCSRSRRVTSGEARPALDEATGSRMLTPAERDEAMAEALRNWDAVERRWREESAQAIAHQAAREAARVAAGLTPLTEAEMAYEIQAECEWREIKRRSRQTMA